MTTGPDEDFAEAVATYITQPKLLQQRSPHRYEFLDKHREALKNVLGSSKN